MNLQKDEPKKPSHILRFFKYMAIEFLIVWFIGSFNTSNPDFSTWSQDIRNVIAFWYSLSLVVTIVVMAIIHNNQDYRDNGRYR